MPHKLFWVVCMMTALAAGGAGPLHGQETAPVKPAEANTQAVVKPPLPAYPDLTSDYTETSSYGTVRQKFTGTLKRAGRKIYRDEQSTSSGPIGYNEYFIYDFDTNILYRLLRDEQVYFESKLSLDQRVDAIRKGWIPAKGAFTVNNVSVELSAKDLPLRQDVYDGRPVELVLREITAAIPEIGSMPARTAKIYSFVWKDSERALPVKISYPFRSSMVIVEYHNMELEASDTDLFTIPKGYVNLTPY